MNIVAHNLLAMNSNRMLGITENKRSKATEKLSSGYKVNRAADDAAGLAISEKMRRQIRGLTRAAANIQDGISYVQTAEGALSEVQDMLHRITELSIQSANGTNEETDRNYLDSEVQQIKSEIDRVFKETSFNERKIWQGGVLNSWEETYSVLEPAVVFNSTSVKFNISETNKWALPNNSSFNINPGDDGLKITWTGFNNTKYESALIGWPDEINGSHSFNLKDYLDTTAHPELEGIDFKFNYKVHPEATKSDVIKGFKNLTASCSPINTEAVEILGSGTGGIYASVSLNYRSVLKSDKDFDHPDDPFAEGTNSNHNINIDLSNPDNWDKTMEFTFDFENIGTVKAKFTDVYYRGSLSTAESEGFWKWHASGSNPHAYKDWYTFGVSPSNGSVNSAVDALINNSGNNLLADSSAGGTIYFNFDLIPDTPFTSKDGKTINNLGSMTLNVNVYANDTVESVRNRLTSMTGVDIYDPTIPDNTFGATPDGNSSNYLSIEKTRTMYAYEDQVHIPIQAGSEAGHKINIDYDCLDIKVLGLESTAVDTADNATQAIDDVKKALEVVSSQRSDFGSYQNRLEHAYNINMNIVENTQAAESQIRDTDMPEEMIRYSNANILSQAGTAMLSQANQTQQNVLNILQ